MIACDRMAEAFGVALEDMLHYEEKNKSLPLPPKGKHMFGTVTVGARGQIVLPKKAREVFQIKAGDTIMVLGDEAQGIALVKADDMIDFVQQWPCLNRWRYSPCTGTKWQIKRIRTKTQKSEENTAGGNGDFYEKTLSG